MSVAFVTMVYNDEFFLKIWLDHYSKYVPRSDLHIVTHGPQPRAVEMAEGCTIVEIERDPRNPRLDQDRLAFLSSYCSELTKTYDRVVMNDVDEIVVLDPLAGDDLAAYLLALPKEQEVVTGLGLEIVHRYDLESDFDYSRGIFEQREFVRVNGWYTKPNIISCPVVWGPDGHGSSYGKIFLNDDLYTFHLKWYDQAYHIRRHEERLGFRFKNDDGEEVILGAGSWSWSAQTYQLVTNSFLAMRPVAQDDNWNLEDSRARIRNSFADGGKGRFKIDWFVEGKLHRLPERFMHFA